MSKQKLIIQRRISNAANWYKTNIGLRMTGECDQ